LKRRTRILSGLGASLALGGCGVVPGALRPAHHAIAFPDVNLSSRPCAIQTVTLLTQSQMPANLTPQGPPESELGARALLGDATDGSVGSAFQSFQPIGMPYPIPRPQIVEVADGIVDYGTVATVERWMGGQEASNRPNNKPMYGNGVERIVATPVLGDDTFMYQIDDGAPYKPAPYNGPYVGRVYTSIQVRDGDLIFAVSIISIPDTGMASLAVTVMRALIARERSVCG
jgi:hypothetical protein